jgi:hypothetical protein
MRQLTERATAAAQIILSVVFLVGYFWVLSDFIHGRVKVDPRWEAVLQTLLAVLTTNVVTIVAYWFSRQRQSDKAE